MTRYTKRNRNGEKLNFWLSYSDMMAALLMVFALILSATLLDMRSTYEAKQAELAEEKKGWYEGSIMFKRVIPIQGTGKFQYRDTLFVARCKANSAIHCYERIVQHLRNRQDVDLRSQFPSAKGKNFSYKYLGEQLPA